MVRNWFGRDAISCRYCVAEILAQIFNPRHGDGVDVLIGKDRKRLLETVAKSGWDALTLALNAKAEMPLQGRLS